MKDLLLRMECNSVNVLLHMVAAAHYILGFICNDL